MCSKPHSIYNQFYCYWLIISSHLSKTLAQKARDYLSQVKNWVKSSLLLTWRKVLPSSRNKRNGMSKSAVFRSSVHPVVVRYCDPDTAHIGCLIPVWIGRNKLINALNWKALNLKNWFELDGMCTVLRVEENDVYQWNKRKCRSHLTLHYYTIGIKQPSYRSFNKCEVRLCPDRQCWLSVFLYFSINHFPFPFGDEEEKLDQFVRTNRFFLFQQKQAHHKYECIKEWNWTDWEKSNWILLRAFHGEIFNKLKKKFASKETANLTAVCSVICSFNANDETVKILWRGVKFHNFRSATRDVCMDICIFEWWWTHPSYTI